MILVWDFRSKNGGACYTGHSKELDDQLGFGHIGIYARETLGNWSVFVVGPTYTMAYDVEVASIHLNIAPSFFGLWSEMGTNWAVAVL